MYWNDAGAMALQKWERENRGLPLREIYDERLRSNDWAETLFESLRQKWGDGPGRLARLARLPTHAGC
jgi:hypothetical protein